MTRIHKAIEGAAVVVVVVWAVVGAALLTPLLLAAWGLQSIENVLARRAALKALIAVRAREREALEHLLVQFQEGRAERDAAAAAARAEKPAVRFHVPSRSE